MIQQLVRERPRAQDVADPRRHRPGVFDGEEGFFEGHAVEVVEVDVHGAGAVRRHGDGTVAGFGEVVGLGEGGGEEGGGAVGEEEGFVDVEGFVVVVGGLGSVADVELDWGFV